MSWRLPNNKRNSFANVYRLAAFYFQWSNHRSQEQYFGCPSTVWQIWQPCMDQNRQRTFYRNITQEFETMIFIEKAPNQDQKRSPARSKWTRIIQAPYDSQRTDGFILSIKRADKKVSALSVVMCNLFRSLIIIFCICRSNRRGWLSSPMSRLHASSRFSP